MLVNGTPIIAMLNQFRIAWCRGFYGQGKTLIAYELAYELYKTGRYRYILGNSNSVWTDSPESVVLREGAFVDAVVILDEGGLFMRMSRDAEKFMIGLRKLNITLLIPSVQPPATRVKFLQIQRYFNMGVLGFPLWIYDFMLNMGTEKEKAKFGIWKPQNIYGVYDTLDYPVDDLYLSDWFEYWMATAKESRPDWCTWSKPPEISGKRNTRSSGQDTRMDDLGGYIDESIQTIEELQDALSISTFIGTEKRRKTRR